MKNLHREMQVFFCVACGDDHGLAHGMECPMQSLRVLLMAWVACAALSGCEQVTSSPSCRAAPRVATPMETAALLQGVIAQGRLATRGTEGGRPAPVILLDRTACNAASTCDYRIDTDVGAAAFDAFAPASLRRALHDHNVVAAELELPALAGVVPVSSATLAQVSDWPDWTGFHRTYPHSAGLMWIAQPVVSVDGRQALMFVAFAQGARHGRHSLYLLLRTRSGWQVTGERVLVES
ncbi:TPA: hypothetical protein QDZ34_002211 [Stenotrophomonas maltophilia]|nr:hypothetical protein [Stenotrophomonas maltophilia]HDS1025581.1 hypothetical protein [Stenotrophomonas maltophilia]HDS1031523.1 hypothetical protein [Stenotrophomonas maltophilia]HDS1034855.1 hypothetical protein [Stenotrophomonas maltophilia]